MELRSEFYSVLAKHEYIYITAMQQIKLFSADVIDSI